MNKSSGVLHGGWPILALEVLFKLYFTITYGGYCPFTAANGRNIIFLPSWHMNKSSGVLHGGQTILVLEVLFKLYFIIAYGGCCRSTAAYGRNIIFLPSRVTTLRAHLLVFCMGASGGVVTYFLEEIYGHLIFTRLNETCMKKSWSWSRY